MRYQGQENVPLFIAVLSSFFYILLLFKESIVGAIRECKKQNGSVTYHAEVRLKGYPPQRASFRTKTLAKKWVQDTESSIKKKTRIKSWSFFLGGAESKATICFALGESNRATSHEASRNSRASARLRALFLSQKPTN
jgi:hypothetical protein